MLALSDINPFDAREAKVYQDEREIMARPPAKLLFSPASFDASSNPLRP